MDIHDQLFDKKLSKDQLAVLRDKTTELPFSGKYLNHTADGMYVCAACGTELFKSKARYESDQIQLHGWPSFADIAKNDAVSLAEDNSYDMHRMEVSCKTCGGHLGHLFDDTSSPSGQHYCINSTSLDFTPDSETSDETTTA